MNAETYWRHNFQQVCNPKQLKRFIVMEVDAIPEKSQPHIVGGAMKSLKVGDSNDTDGKSVVHVLGKVTVTRK